MFLARAHRKAVRQEKMLGLQSWITCFRLIPIFSSNISALANDNSCPDSEPHKLPTHWQETRYKAVLSRKHRFFPLPFSFDSFLADLLGAIIVQPITPWPTNGTTAILSDSPLLLRWLTALSVFRKRESATQGVARATHHRNYPSPMATSSDDSDYYTTPTRCLGVVAQRSQICD